MEYNLVLWVEGQPRFQSSISPQSSESKSKAKKSLLPFTFWSLYLASSSNLKILAIYFPPKHRLVFVGLHGVIPYMTGYVGLLISLWLFLFPIFLFAAQPK
jgi:hypothetical protein